MTIRIGFTGTSKGMASEQKLQLAALFGVLKDEYAGHQIEFHEGHCIGADEQAAKLAKQFGFRVVAHPGYNSRNPSGTLFRSDWGGADETREPQPFIKRDKHIVDETIRMIATPLTRQETTRSGTWTTIRYARRQGKKIDILYPAV
jgi:hypothetical protein